MVNRGRSGGCATCKQRRVKCDEAKPKCHRCQRLRLRCEGYKKKPVGLIFRDQNYKFDTGAVRELQNVGARGRHNAENCQQQTVQVPDKAADVQDEIIKAPIPDKARDILDNTVSVQGRTIEVDDKAVKTWYQAAVLPFRHPPAEPDTAVPFFLWHYASIGRDMQSARGFFEMLIPVYSSQPQTSALSLAVSAVASEILSLWRHRTDSFRSPRKSYAHAVSSVRRALQNCTERSKPATVFAVLVLQLYENMAAVYGLRAATHIHQNGAASLLPFVDIDGDVNSTIREYIRRFMLHTEIAAAMRQKRPLRAVAYSWIGSKDLMAAPDNPSSVLDAIGACVAELQARYVRLPMRKDAAPSSHRALRELRVEAKRIDERLLAWAQRVPRHWNPLTLESGQGLDSAIPTYQSVCEVYPSCPIANLWNLWRFQRFLLAKITLASLNTILSDSYLEPVEDLGEVEELFICKQTIQELVDSICYSVPFYLGNRTKPCSIADFTDPEILLPSHRPRPLDAECCLEGQAPNFKTQRDDEHRHHVIAQGPWHAMSPLSRLLTLLSEEDHHHGGQVILASFLRPGQLEWIRKQFLRVTTLLHLPSAKPDDYKEVGGTWNWSAERPAEMDIGNEYLVKGNLNPIATNNVQRVDD